MKIEKESIIQSLPFVLAEDDELKALAESISQILCDHIDEIAAVKIYPRINELDEDMLNTLAYDYKIDWWDENATTQEKRDTVNLCWYTHKHIGTPAAVQKVIDVYYPGTYLEEWFEYNGHPYHFRLVLNVGRGVYDNEKAVGIADRMELFKNLRSLLDYIKVAMRRDYTIMSGVGTLTTIEVTTEMTAYSDSGTYLIDESNNILYDETENLLWE